VNESKDQPFRSPCCGVDSVPTAWQVDLARANTRGVLRIACGTNAAGGCGKAFVVTVDPAPSAAPNPAG
jgi:hypothetical protein